VINQSFHMKNDIENVDRMVMSLKSVVKDILDSTTMFRFEICLSETLTNSVKHADTHDKETPIEVTLIETASALVVDVFDPVGAGFFDLRDHAKDLDSVDLMAESGRGLGLILQCADAVTYGALKGRNRLALDFLKPVT
jgi:serine/threonine-protein kinase RsbW